MHERGECLRHKHARRTFEYHTSLTCTRTLFIRMCRNLLQLFTRQMHLTVDPPADPRNVLGSSAQPRDSIRNRAVQLQYPELDHP